jgi:hypothetical protein
MDAKDIRNLQEAYLEVYQEQQLDEGLKKAFIKAYGRAYAAASDDYADEDDFEQAGKIRSHIERRYGPETAKHADEHGYVQSTGRRYGRPEPRIQPNRKFKTTKAGKMPKNAQTAFKNELILNKSERDSPTIGGVRKPKHWGKVGGEKGLPEQVDLYDIILSHLLDEGYAETQQAAEAIMVNMSEEWREDIMEGMSMKDFKANRKKLQRKEASADARKRGHEGKTWVDSGKTYSPDQAKRNRANMTDATRRALYRVANNPDDDGGDDHYPASKTKNPKKLRKQKAMGEIGESYDLYDIILSHLLDEGYAETQEAAEAIMVNMSEDWREDIMEGAYDRAQTNRADAYGRAQTNRADAYGRAQTQKKKKEKTQNG